MNKTLFRRQALQFKESGQLGGFAIPRLPLHDVFSILCILCFAALLVLVFTGNYSSPIQGWGWVEAEPKAATVRAALGGVVVDVQVELGESVEEGQVVARLQTSLDSEAVEARLDAIVKETEAISIAIGHHRRLINILNSKFAVTWTSTQSQIDDLISLLELERIKHRALDKKVQRQRALIEQQVASISSVSDYEIDLTASRQKTIEIEGKIERAFDDHALLGLEKEERIVEHELKVVGLRRELEHLSQQWEALRSEHYPVIRAPIGGRVTALNASRGRSVVSGDELFRISPERKKVIGKLMIPAGSIGFVRVGADVAIQYHAFPYQTYGQFSGTILTLEEAVVSASASSRTSDTDSPHYMAEIEIASDYILASGKDFYLMDGMTFDAVLGVEHVTLIQWLFEPIFATVQRYRH